MRTSTAWLLVAVLVLVASLAAYDLALRQAFRRRNTTADPDTYVTLGNPQDFTEVVLPDSGSLGVKITPGPFRVRVRAQYARLIHLRQQGHQLIVTAELDEAVEDEEMLLINCPRLAKVTTTTATQQQVAAQAVMGNIESHCLVTIENFRRDTLSLLQAQHSSITLSGNHLRYLQATVGSGRSSQASLSLQQDNSIAAAKFAVAGHSELSTYGLIIPHLRYHFADSAVIQLLGGSLRR